MLIERPFFLRIQRVIPAPVDICTTPGKICSLRCTPPESPAVVIDFHHAAFSDIPCLRIARMHPQRLASLNFRRPADAAVVVLTVQAGARLAGEQMKRPPRRLLSLPGGLLFIPPRMAGIRDSQTRRRWRKRVQFAGGWRADSAADRRENRRENLRPLRRAVFQHPLLPEVIERGQRTSSCARGLDSS